MAASSISTMESTTDSTSSQPSQSKECSRSHPPPPITHLEPGIQYPSDHLINFVSSNSPLQRYSTLSDLQRLAFERFWTSPLSSIQNHQTQRSDTLLVLSHFFSIFDDLFFNHSLKSSVKLSYTRDRTYDATLGQTNRSLHNEYITISIISPSRSFLRSNHHALKADIDSLLREMCHAFLLLWLCEECSGLGGTRTSCDYSARQYEAAWQSLALILEGNTWNDARFRGLNAELGISQLIGGMTPDHLLQSPQPAVLRQAKQDEWTIVEREVWDHEGDEESQRLVSAPVNIKVPTGRNKTRRLQKPIPMSVIDGSEGDRKEKWTCRSCWNPIVRFMTWCGILPKENGT